jgi:dTDP-L-rhamnose 4-epimerase
MKRILISGGMGFIGTHIAKQFVEQHHGVLLFDNLSPQIHGAVPALCSLPLLKSASVEVARGDVRNESDWAAALSGVECVLHLAAETGTAQSMYEISRYTDTNVGGTAALLNYLANCKHQVRKVILASSRSVYGEGAYRCGRCGIVYPPMRTAEALGLGRWEPSCPSCGGEIKATPTLESARTSPASVYAVTKLAQEDLVRVTCEALGIPFVIFRFQNVYGEGQSLKNPYTGILSIFSNQIRAGKPVNLYEDGQESRDFVHVSDVASAVTIAATTSKADGQILNVGSGKATTIEQIALLLHERFGSTIRAVVSRQFRLGDIRHGCADIGALGTLLGFVPQVTLEQGLTRFVEWVKLQPGEPDRLDEATQALVARSLMP